ncbi:MAG: ArsS family sensor histidine kinase, partial [Thiovulaceae bacterium]|nr:ArsS family sensor histidine kinase [Sulfurimonadaceae bacterium]
MKIRSLFYSVILVALVSFTTIAFLYAYFVKNDTTQHNDTMFDRYQIVRSIMLNSKTNLTHVEFDRYLRQFDMSIVFNVNEKRRIIRDAKLLKHDKRQLITQTLRPASSPFISRQEIQLDISMVEEDGYIYFYLRTVLGDLLIFDRLSRPYEYTFRIFSFLLVSIVLLGIFTFILIKLYPLRKISQTLARFGEGDLDVRLSFKGNNEIVEIAEAFNKAAAKINALVAGRTLFMRNMMHELKTPIAKGRLLAEFIDDPVQKQRFDDLFIRMQTLIDDLALLDQVKSSVGIKIDESYNVRDLIDEAIDMSLIDTDAITVKELVYQKIKVDYQLFVVVLKNLIDNGIKYSSDKKVEVCVDKDFIDVISVGT